MSDQVVDLASWFFQLLIFTELALLRRVRESEWTIRLKLSHQDHWGEVSGSDRVFWGSRSRGIFPVVPPLGLVNQGSSKYTFFPVPCSLKHLFTRRIIFWLCDYSDLLKSKNETGKTEGAFLTVKPWVQSLEP